MSRYFRYVRNVAYNLYASIVSLFIKRSDRIIVMGAWMGNRFADNSRYLFQFLSDNKNILNLEHVIWITRNDSLYQELKGLGYEVCMCGTKESKQWHLRAGYHLICNNYSYGKILPDIDTKYSWTAKKIQLWHGVGMKSVGKASNATSPKRKLVSFINNHHKLVSFIYEGGWSDAYVLSTSELNAEINKRIFLIDDSRIIRAAYPRNCSCLSYLSDEKAVIDSVKKYNYRILYLPTFRDDNSNYIHPLASETLKRLLNEEKILWIEKAHAADKNYKAPTGNNIRVLNTEFDCNVLYPLIDIVITDYSSVAFDGIYKNIPTIMYVPDYDEFKNGKVGFLFDVEEKCGSIMTYDIPSLIDFIKECINHEFLVPQRRETYHYIQSEFFELAESNYNQIWDSIIKKAN